MKYGIEVKIGNVWSPVRPPRDPPYAFDTKIEAETMAIVLYPRQVRAAERGEPEVVRIVEKE